MIKSMTGYGKGEANLPSGKLTIEIRTLNGKNADISIKSSLLPKDRELEARQKIADALVRGTIDVYLKFEPATGASAARINAAHSWPPSRPNSPPPKRVFRTTFSPPCSAFPMWLQPIRKTPSAPRTGRQ